MNNEYLYTVAGHTFRLVVEDTNPVRGRMSNYLPFEETTHQKEIFTLTVCDSVSLAEATPVMMNHDKSSEFCNLDIYRTSDGYLFELYFLSSNHFNGRLRISDNFRMAEVTLHGSMQERYAALDRSMMLCYLLATAEKETLLMHASAVVNAGYAYLFLGKSGTGKSTHSNLWLRYIEEVGLLNDDHPVLRIHADGQAIVYGTPWSGKTPCYRNASAPVGGFVRIRRAKENRICRLNNMEAYASLMPSCSGMSWEPELASGRDHTLQKLITTTPCWVLECLPDEEAAQLCASTIRQKA